MGRYLVTNAQFALFIAAGGYEEPGRHWWSNEGWEWRQKGQRRWSDRVTNQSEYWDDSRFGKSRRGYPVVGISWYEANAYCAWLTELLLRRHRAEKELEPACHDLIAGLPEDATEVRLPTEEEWVAAAGGEEGELYPWGPEWGESRANTSEGRIGGTTPVGMYPSGQGHGVWDMAGNVWEWMASEGDVKPLRGGSWRDDPEVARVGARFGFDPDCSDLDVGLRVVGSPASSGS